MLPRVLVVWIFQCLQSSLFHWWLMVCDFIWIFVLFSNQHVFLWIVHVVVGSSNVYKPWQLFWWLMVFASIWSSVLVSKQQALFQVGEHVFIKVRPKKSSLRLGSCDKLAHRYCGPFEILSRIGQVVYQLALPPNIRVHNVFSYLCIKKICTWCYSCY